jgi:hypothetical protein
MGVMSTILQKKTQIKTEFLEAKKKKTPLLAGFTYHHHEENRKESAFRLGFHHLISISRDQETNV